ncbi:DUF2169 domain-containing protein [Ideonella sp. A 288]|uniref:DUF2169 family type VI secretion system accessory protein n=1 Tax=Ideonella sp. A 288 TaxID=1962181 RepID=UPI000B4AE2D5|nr:DUF2169 domain-containing protein [Ideonella sp. A 288]
MKFVNLTPFGALAYRGIDAHDRGHHVFAMRTVYRLRRANAHLQLPQDWFDAELIDEDAPGLITEDSFVSDAGRSSTLAESDLVPFKPRCDVLVTGQAHAPGGRLAKSWVSRLRLCLPQLDTDPARRNHVPPLRADDDPDFDQRVAWQMQADHARREHPAPPGPNGELAWQVVLDKRLRVHGPRHFVRGALGRWTLGSAHPVAAVPLRYEHAWGGASVVPNPEHPRDTSAPEHLLNEVCYSNPLGCGWLHAGYFKALKRAHLPLPHALPAPQFEYPDDPVRHLEQVEQAPGLDVAHMAEVCARQARRPAGLGPLGRPWTPRIQQAGTYDKTWLEQHWPNLPRDFDMRYWNCAPADQQIAYPRPDFLLELGHLIDPALAPTGQAVVPMPGHRAAVLLHLKSGLMMQTECVIDTVHVDTDAMTVALVWRASVSDALGIERAEARFEIDPGKPLITLTPTRSEPSEVMAHG